MNQKLFKILPLKVLTRTATYMIPNISLPVVSKQQPTAQVVFQLFDLPPKAPGAPDQPFNAGQLRQVTQTEVVKFDTTLLTGDLSLEKVLDKAIEVYNAQASDTEKITLAPANEQPAK